jgi:hypothetical protein
MKTTPALFPVLLLASLAAQEGKPATPPMPQPKHAQHEALRALAGTWDVVMKSEAMPGVPGMEKATESKGTERAELLHGGLWLRSVVDGTHDGKPFQGIWLAGYDPFAKQYVGTWVSSADNEGPCSMNGTYDEAKKTWTWSGKTEHGDMRTVTKFDSADSFVETCYSIGADGKETKAMEITRTRSKAPAAAANEARAAKAPAELAALHKDIGEWTATLRCTMPGQTTPIEEKGTERVASMCDGRWLWADFNGQFSGAPFSGSWLYGIDPKTNKVVGFWIDSMTPTWCRTEGAASAGGDLSLSGSCVDHNGKPMQVKQTIQRPDANTRTMRMDSTCEQGPSSMEITYRRKA